MFSGNGNGVFEFRSKKFGRPGTSDICSRIRLRLNCERDKKKKNDCNPSPKPEDPSNRRTFRFQLFRTNIVLIHLEAAHRMPAF